MPHKNACQSKWSSYKTMLWIKRTPIIPWTIGILFGCKWAHFVCVFDVYRRNIKILVVLSLLHQSRRTLWFHLFHISGAPLTQQINTIHTFTDTCAPMFRARRAIWMKNYCHNCRWLGQNCGETINAAISKAAAVTQKSHTPSGPDGRCLSSAGRPGPPSERKAVAWKKKRDRWLFDRNTPCWRWRERSRAAELTIKRIYLASFILFVQSVYALNWPIWPFWLQCITITNCRQQAEFGSGPQISMGDQKKRRPTRATTIDNIIGGSNSNTPAASFGHRKLIAHPYCSHYRSTPQTRRRRCDAIQSALDKK